MKVVTDPWSDWKRPARRVIGSRQPLLTHAQPRSGRSGHTAAREPPHRRERSVENPRRSCIGSSEIGVLISRIRRATHCSPFECAASGLDLHLQGVTGVHRPIAVGEPRCRSCGRRSAGARGGPRGRRGGAAGCRGERGRAAGQRDVAAEEAGEADGASCVLRDPDPADRAAGTHRGRLRRGASDALQHRVRAPTAGRARGPWPCLPCRVRRPGPSRRTRGPGRCAPRAGPSG